MVSVMPLNVPSSLWGRIGSENPKSHLWVTLLYLPFIWGQVFVFLRVLCGRTLTLTLSLVRMFPHDELQLIHVRRNVRINVTFPVSLARTWRCVLLLAMSVLTMSVVLAVFLHWEATIFFIK